MKKTLKYIGLDVHKKSISIGIADDGRDGEVRYYGEIDNNMDQLDKVIRKLISLPQLPLVLLSVMAKRPQGYAKNDVVWEKIW